MADGDECDVPIEQVVASIWAEVLGVAAIGPGSDFFALGGNSLMAIQISILAREELERRAIEADEPSLMLLLFQESGFERFVAGLPGRV